MALVYFLDGLLTLTKSSVRLVIGEGGFLGTDAPAVNNWGDRNFLSLACVCSQHSFWVCGSLWFLLSVLMPVTDAVATPLAPPGQWNWGVRQMEGSGCPLLGESGAESLERKGSRSGKQWHWYRLARFWTWWINSSADKDLTFHRLTINFHTPSTMGTFLCF